MKDTVIVVTGGLGKVGTAVTARLEAAGATTVVTTRDAAKAEAFDAKAKAEGRRARARVLDLCDEAAITAFVTAVAEEFGPVYGLVNNAYGSVPEARPEDVSIESFAQAARTDLGAPLALSRALAGGANGTALRAVVNVGSIYGVMAPDFSIYSGERVPSMPTYGAMKAGLMQLTRYLAVYWAERAIRVNAVSLGGVAAGQDPAFLEAYGRMVPQRRMITADEAAGAILFLLGPDASGITGTNLIVDAGRHAW